MRFLWFTALLLLPALALAVTEEQKEFDAAQSDDSKSLNKGVKWNEFDLGIMTMRIGGGIGFDAASYNQDSTSAKQMPDLTAETALRDFRLLFKGRFKFAENLSYTLGYMYDGAQDDWRFRQTGLMLDIPEWNGNLFIGRTKEGISANKIMVGYYMWYHERNVANDAFLPILADGVKWTGRTGDGKLVYNLGYYDETITNYESYDKNDQIAVARAVWLPPQSDEKSVLHLGIQGRYGTDKDGFLQFRSKPESFPAQDYVVDTGRIKATSNTITGAEVYYSPGPLMFGGEYFVNQVNSSSAKDPRFHGGEVFAAWLLTGETRPYNKKGAYFEAISPERSFLKGGPGAIEFVLRYSYADLDDQSIDGGKFKRITPMLNWYLNDNIRLEFVYGYGELEKNNSTGTTQFFTTRLQMIL